jgi:hypothetical protein
MTTVVATRVIGTRKFYRLTDGSTTEVVWNGGLLLPEYNSSSSWEAVERYYRKKLLGCLEALGKDSNDELPGCTALNASPLPARSAANRRTRRTSLPA